MKQLKNIGKKIKKKLNFKFYPNKIIRGSMIHRTVLMKHKTFQINRKTFTIENNRKVL